MLTRHLLNRCLRLDTHTVKHENCQRLESSYFQVTNITEIKRVWPLLQEQVELEFGRHPLYVGESFR